MDETLLREFYVDRAVVDRLLWQSDDGYLARVVAFIRALRELGIRHRNIHVEDFDVFRHRALAETVEAFARDNPSDELPLAGITLTQYARAEHAARDLAETHRHLVENADSMTRYATRYNVDVSVQVFAQSLSAEQAIRILEFAGTDAVDSLGFFFEFGSAGLEGVAALKKALAAVCAHPACRNPKARFGSFPFCYFPPEALKVLYRDAVDPLRGRVGDQRALLADLQKKARDMDFPSPCRDCRCRVPCYVYTDVSDHSEHRETFEARRETTLVFAGGSVCGADVPDDPDLVWAGPAEQGDMIAAVLDGFENILLIDGYFYTRFPCTTFEVLLALDQGVRVLGASSIGALRAIELDVWGMVGTGRVYEYLKRQEIKPYHVVAQTYDEQDRPLTVPLIQIVYFLVCASADGVIDRDEHEALRALADRIHFTCLSFESFLQEVRETATVADAAEERLRAYFDEKGRAHFDIKKQDALQLLASFRSVLAKHGKDDVATAIRTASRRNLSRLTSKYPPDQHFALSADWRTCDSVVSEGGATRDRRVCSATDTCVNARRFLDGLDVVVADTTRYDAADSFILSTFFVPFYFLDYYPSSATGNGDVFEEALASAFMELVERIPASALQVRGRRREDLVAEPFPREQMPQHYNWGTDAGMRQLVLREHGYVQVTDILSGGDVYVPGYSLMFAYSGTDGYASGNSLTEAALYGLYEVIERDTCQLHHQSAACRGLLPRLMLDPGRIDDDRCATLLRQADEKGCDVVLFSLPNLYGLPCVMCHVYDRNRRIQCHGGIAVRSSLEAAAYAALHEAYMQYITYFVGTRDDYRAFAPLKQARIAYESARETYLGPHASPGPVPESVVFDSLRDELEHVLDRLAGQGVPHVFVADMSPRPEYRLRSVKVIVPTLELWFCPAYVPSPFFPARAERTAELVRAQVARSHGNRESIS